MIGLLISTILTSAADSLNPIAIVQQFVLQGMVKKPKHIWYFILPTGITNLLGGFLAYYGFVAFLGNFMNRLYEKFSLPLLVAELLLGVGFLVALIWMLIKNNRKSKKEKQPPQAFAAEAGEEEVAMAAKIKSVSPAALVALGVGATISELATALPYFAFLAILLNYKLTFFQVTWILVLYNFIYTLPLIILYFIYRKAQQQFDRLYRAVKTQMVKWKSVIAPAFLGAVGVFLTAHALIRML